MSQRFTYRSGAALPNLTLPWQEESSQNTWTDLDLSSGYTFALTLVGIDGVTVLTKSTGITGADGSVVIAWASTDLDLSTGTYELRLAATETATSKIRHHEPDEPIRIQIT